MKQDLDALLKLAYGRLRENMGLTPVTERRSAPKPTAIGRQQPTTSTQRHRAPVGETEPFRGVMLAQKWDGRDPTGWWMSEKLDGMRAYWTGRRLVSRNDKPIAAPAWFLALLPQGEPLDGELIVGRGRFHEVVSIVRRGVPDERWDQVRYHLFAAPAQPDIEHEIARLRQLVAETDDGHLVAVQQTRCKGEAHLQRYLTQLEKLGAEGVMLRAAGSRYERARSWSLLKVKNFHDDEAKIVGYQPGKGRHTGRLGAYVAKLLSNGATFEVGTGLSDEQRNDPLPKGTIITIRYQELQPSGKPRFPVFVAVRDYE